jgi:thiosulfate dehydrogenase
VGAEMEGQGLPRLRPIAGDTTRGVALFASTCARCHGPGGQGTSIAPPLWGPHSYNVGAGMANVVTAASFIHALMPLDRAQRLNEQQAFDIATYINSRPRPLFKKKAQDYPKGGKPPGA